MGFMSCLRKGISGSRAAVFILCGSLLLFLTGCDPTAGHFHYEISYPDGFVRNPYIWDEATPVEGTDYFLKEKKSENYEKTRTYDLQILDQDGNLLYEYPDIGSRTMRGEAGLWENTVWICAESWSAPHYNGYVDGFLVKSVLLLVDMADGQILFQEETGEGELYLTTVGGRCYFYKPGKEAEEKLFGLVHIPEQQAEIFYRELSDWSGQETDFVFDFVNTDKILEDGHYKLCKMIFKIKKDSIYVALTAYEQVDSENNEWEYVERAGYEVPIG